MNDVVITGASRGIGRALALALASPSLRIVLSARDEARLEALLGEIRESGGEGVVVPGDLGSLAGARALGGRLTALVAAGATLVHNAGLWPTRRVLGADGLEQAFMVNHLGPLAMQEPLVASGRVARIMVVSAGLLVKGRFDPDRTPSARDFSRLRTYCTTKLCFAVAMRDFARRHSEVDVVVLHPGVVRTDLGATPGPLGWLVSLAKRGWEPPEACAERLAALFTRERWSPPGEARWLFEGEEQPWPEVVSEARTTRDVLACTARLLGSGLASVGT